MRLAVLLGTLSLLVGCSGDSPSPELTPPLVTDVVTAEAAATASAESPTFSPGATSTVAVVTRILKAPGRTRLAACVEVLDGVDVALEDAAGLLRTELENLATSAPGWPRELSGAVVDEGCPSRAEGLGEIALRLYQPPCTETVSEYLMFVFIAPTNQLDISFPGLDGRIIPSERLGIAGSDCKEVGSACYYSPEDFGHAAATCVQVATGFIGG